MFGIVFFLVFLLFALGSVAIGVLKGRKYNWQFSLAKVIIVIFSIIISMFIAAIAAYLIAGLLVSLISSSPSGDLSELFEKVKSLPQAIQAIAAMLIAPLIYTVVFFMARPLLSLTKRPIARLLMKISKKTEAAPSENEEEKSDKNAIFKSDKKFDALGALCGGICSLLVFIALSAPTAGFFSILHGEVELLGRFLPEEVVEISDDLTDNAGITTIKYLGGGLIYNGITTYPVDDELVSISTEFEYVSSLSHAVAYASDDEISPEDKAEAIRATGDAFDHTKLFPTVISDLVAAASDDWNRGKDFCGIEAPSLGEDFDKTLSDLFSALADSDKVTICEDYHTIANSVALIVQHDALEQLGEDGDTLHLFKNEELISGIMLEMLHNERFAYAIEDFTNAGVSIVTSALEVYADPDALYDGFIEDMMDAYKDAYSQTATGYDRFTTLSKSVKNVYDNYGIELTDGVGECVAISMLDVDLKTTEDFEKFFGAGITPAPSPISTLGYSTEQLAIYGNRTVRDVAPDIITLTKNATDIEKLKTDVQELLCNRLDYVNSISSVGDRYQIASDIIEPMYKAKTLGETLSSDNALVTDAKGIDAISVRVTKDDLYISLADVSDKDAEAKALAKVLSSTVDIVDKLEESDQNMVDIIKSFGPVLDSFHSCKSIGDDGTADLVSSILQSETVRSSIGFTVIQANEVARVINRNATTGSTYTMLLGTVGRTIDIIKASSEKEDTTETVKELIQEMTPASAETLKQLTTAETVQNYGVPEDQAEKVSEVLSDMFGQMSAAKEEGMTEDQYHDEALAVDDMMTIAMHIGESADGQTIFGEDGATGITATEYVDRVMASTVISTTVVNASYDKESDTIVNNPLGMARELTEEEKSELVGAIDTKWKEQVNSSNDLTANAEQQKLLGSIAAILGVELEFSGNSVIAK